MSGARIRACLLWAVLNMLNKLKLNVAKMKELLLCCSSVAGIDHVEHVGK